MNGTNINEDNETIFSDYENQEFSTQINVDNNINNIGNTTFDINKLKLNFDQVRTDKHGRKQIPIKYDETIFKITTPLLRIPFGIGISEIENNKQYKIALSFDDINNNKNISDFYEFIKNIENHVKDEVFENQEFLQKGNNKNKKSKEVIDEFFSSKLYENDKYAPLFALNLRINTEYSNTDLYHNSRENKLLIHDNMNFDKTKGCTVKCEISCTNLWISGGKYGISWKVDNVIIYNKKVNITNVLFN